MVIIKTSTQKDKFKLLHVFISEILLMYGNISYGKIKELLKSDFNFEVTLNDIKEYFEENYDTIKNDIVQQCKNLGIRYE